jgi:starch phosphorylase
LKPVCTINVVPSLPPAIEALREIAYNIRWAWNHEAVDLFRRLDSDLWEATGHNPVLMLGSIEQSRLAGAAEDEAFLAHMERVRADLSDAVSQRSGWFRRTYPHATDLLVAYFSAEFGLTECLSIFAGGLGILAGDHLKSASDLGVPLVGVGLLYQQGYFRQYLNQAGWQQESYENNDFSTLPLTLVTTPDGEPVTVDVEFPGRNVVAQVWRVDAGRTRLFLLDTNIDQNAPPDRDITDQLYGGDRDLRIRQEIVLGIGGYRALEKLGLTPTVFHMNEGHSAFLALEHIRRLMERFHLSYAEARQLAAASLVFTTHTPVEAGHDYFAPELMDHYLGAYPGRLGLSRDEFLGLGRRNPGDHGELFCMTVLAMRLAAFRNAVSKLHGKVSRAMWRVLWPGVPEEELPITHVTNGVHFQSWISAEMNEVYERYLGPRWREEPADARVWKRVEAIPSEELWRTHERRRERTVAFTRRRLREQLKRRGAPPSEVQAATEVLDPEALTIGFARRFATYKRATLLLRDPARLSAILNSPDRPVQVIFAGKAHPQDGPGKELIQQIVSMCRQKEFRNRLVFVEDYDPAVARALVQGVDIWLNTPLRPYEASGTSGKKAAANGALNLSTLDGWWDEAWQSAGQGAVPIGWSIGSGENYTDRALQDQVEANALYELLERDVVPAFYERSANRVPQRWIARMKASLSTLCHEFNTHRMVKEYSDRFYLVAHATATQFAQDSAAPARALADWERRVREAWPNVRVTVEAAPLERVEVGKEMLVKARVALGGLNADDVSVELYMGRVDANGEIVGGSEVAMSFAERLESGESVFAARAVRFTNSGLHGYTVRVMPDHHTLPTAFWTGLIAWASGRVTAARA